MQYFRYSLMFIVGMITGSSIAQTGPGGVGNSTNNVLWLKADAGTSTTVSGAAVSSWNDQSGNSIHVTQSSATQQPLFQSNVINGFPAILFDNDMTGQNDKLLGPDSPLLDNTSGYSFFTVTRPVNFGTNTILSKRIAMNNQESFMFFYWTGNKIHVDVESTNDRIASSAAFSANNDYLLNMVYDGSLSASQRVRIYRGELLDKIGYETSALVPDNNSPLIIGSTDASDSRPFGGYIAETIIFRQALNKASRIIVNNYLSAKYNIAAGANDFYAGDTPANGNYDFQVAGVGTDTIMPGTVVGSNTSFDPSASGGMGITMASGFEYGDYIFAGHATMTNSAILTDVAGMSGIANSRWQRIWYIDIRNTATATMVHIDFDMSDGGVSPNLATANPSDYVLLYRSGQTGSWTELTTATSITGDRIRFSGITLSSDGYYTIGTKDWGASPLPVELLSFTATHKDTYIATEWVTASEKDNSFFTLERSSDNAHFYPLYQVQGAGTTLNNTRYHYPDYSPEKGMNYYRLKQTDQNGDVHYWPAVSVLWEETGQTVLLFPNPNNGHFRAIWPYSENEEVEVCITDASGRQLYCETLSAETLLHTGIAPSERLIPGCYLVRFSAGTHSEAVRMLVE